VLPSSLACARKAWALSGFRQPSQNMQPRLRQWPAAQPQQKKLQSKILLGKAVTAFQRGDRKDQTPLPLPHVSESKRVVLVRHGQSTWNAEGRIQGSTDFAELTQKGRAQADTTRITVGRCMPVTCDSYVPAVAS